MLVVTNVNRRVLNPFSFACIIALSASVYTDVLYRRIRLLTASVGAGFIAIA